MDEYIEREALMKNFCGYDLTKCVKYGNKDAGQRHNSYSTMMMYEIADEIIGAPAADVVPVVHGRWEPREDVMGFVRCSVCHDCNIYDDWADGKKWRYCPNCGARMDLEEPNETKET